MSAAEEENQPPRAAFRLGEMGLNNFAPYLMNRIMARYNASLRDEMGALGLTTAKTRALATLSVLDGVLIGELAVYAVVEKSTLSRALDGLEEDGLVQRVADSSDQRATRVMITPAGRRAFERIWPEMAQSYHDMFEGISKQEQRAFVETLQKILRNVRHNPF